MCSFQVYFFYVMLKTNVIISIFNFYVHLSKECVIGEVRGKGWCGQRAWTMDSYGKDSEASGSVRTTKIQRVWLARSDARDSARIVPTVSDWDGHGQ